MKLKVISVFSGLGKTTVGNKYENVCDLQSSQYRFDYSNIKLCEYEKMKSLKSRKVNADWPHNYINALLEAMKKYDIILVPSNEDIRKILIENKIDFLFVLPSYDSRDILLKRYKERGNSQELIKEVMEYFDNWSREQEAYDYPIIILDKEKYLEDLLLELGFLNTV